MTKHDITKRVIRSGVRNLQVAGASEGTILAYIDSFIPLWVHSPAVIDMITRLKSDVTRVTYRKRAKYE